MQIHRKRLIFFSRKVQNLTFLTAILEKKSDPKIMFHINVNIIKHKYIRYHILDQLSNKRTKTTHTNSKNLHYGQYVSLCSSNTRASIYKLPFYLKKNCYSKCLEKNHIFIYIYSVLLYKH